MRFLKVKICLFSILFFQQTTICYPQNNITGKVLDEGGNPFPGVNVIVKGTSRGTSTDVEGRFSIPTNPTGTLVFSFFGYLTLEEEIRGRKYIELRLKVDTKASKFASLHVPSLSDFFVDAFPQLQSYTKKMTAKIEVKFNDNISKYGEGILMDYDTSHVTFISPVDLFYSSYDATLKQIVIEYEGKKLDGELFLLPDTSQSINQDLAVIRAAAKPFSLTDEIIFSNKKSKSYFTNSEGYLVKLPLKSINKNYEELHLQNDERLPISLGAPVYNKYGVSGLIVDNTGETLIATQISKSLFALKERYLVGDSSKTLFNTYKYNRKFNFRKLLPVGLNIGVNFSSTFFNGADLTVKNTAFTPSTGATVDTYLLGFTLGYELSYNYVESKVTNSTSTYTRLRNTHYGHSLFLERSIFNIREYTFSLSGGLSYFYFSSVLYNAMEQEVSLETALMQDIETKFKSFWLGLKIELPTFIGERHNLGLRLLLINSNTSYLDVNVSNPANSSPNDDMLLKAQLYYSFRLL